MELVQAAAAGRTLLQRDLRAPLYRGSIRKGITEWDSEF
jgi:hypothetical protein